MTSPISCSTRIIAIESSSRMSRMNRAMSSVSSRFMPATGSSSRSSSGSMASARPSSTRFCTPYGSNATGYLRHRAISRKSMMSSATARLWSSSFFAGPTQIAPSHQEVFVRTWRPSMMLSSTVMCGKSSMFWNVRATPSAAIRSGLRPRISWPFHLIDPDCGLYTPLMQLKIDVLPAPFGPITANSSPSVTAKLTSSSALMPLKARLTSSNSRRCSKSPLSPLLLSSGDVLRDVMTATASGVCSA